MFTSIILKMPLIPKTDRNKARNTGLKIWFGYTAKDFIFVTFISDSSVLKVTAFSVWAFLTKSNGGFSYAV